MIQSVLSIFPLLLIRPISRRTLYAIITWSKSLQLNFNVSNKCTHIAFKSKFVSSYNLSDTAISITDSQKDLDLVVSNDLSWANHYNHIIPHAFKILGPICRSFSPSLNLSVKMKLYLIIISPLTVDVLYSSLVSILTKGYSEYI